MDSEETVNVILDKLPGRPVLRYPTWLWSGYRACLMEMGKIVFPFIDRIVHIVSKRYFLIFIF